MALHNLSEVLTLWTLIRQSQTIWQWLASTTKLSIALQHPMGAESCLTFMLSHTAYLSCKTCTIMLIADQTELLSQLPCCSWWTGVEVLTLTVPHHRITVRVRRQYLGESHIDCASFLCRKVLRAAFSSVLHQRDDITSRSRCSPSARIGLQNRVAAAAWCLSRPIAK